MWCKSAKMPENKWYESWFDTGYYHLLYDQRDEEEAKAFIQKLVRHIQPRPHDLICDLACGNGRHARVIAAMGYNVVGLDLSQNSISMAREAAHDTNGSILHGEESKNAPEKGEMEFYVHDMRKPFRVRYFDWIFNLFTSFGYFETDQEHLTVLKNASRALKPTGGLILDFLNANKTVENLVPRSSYQKEGIHFEVERMVENGFIKKQIHIFENDKSIRFTEKVRAYTLTDFEKMMNQVGLRIEEVFGSYNLDTFDPQQSERLIIKARLQ